MFVYTGPKPTSTREATMTIDYVGARQIESWARTQEAIYVYFDNDQSGYAAQNALTLKSMVFQDKTAAL